MRLSQAMVVVQSQVAWMWVCNASDDLEAMIHAAKAMCAQGTERLQRRVSVMRLNQKGQTFFVIDYETTGLDPTKDDPIEVGIIVTDERFNAIDSFSSLISTAWV